MSIADVATTNSKVGGESEREGGTVVGGGGKTEEDVVPPPPLELAASAETAALPCALEESHRRAETSA